MTSRKLKSVALDELSLVDVPADPNAKIAFWKRAKDDYKDLTDAQKGRMKKLMDDGMSEEDAYKACQKNVTNKGDGVVTVEELTKQLEALQAQVTDLTKSKANLLEEAHHADRAEFIGQRLQSPCPNLFQCHCRHGFVLCLSYSCVCSHFKQATRQLRLADD